MSSQEKSTTPKIPKKIGPYQIQSLLTKHKYYHLYLGIHPTTKEIVAIKTLLKKYLKDPSIAERFLKEVQITKKSQHPNIIKVFDHGKWEGGYYLCMEFIQGVSLRHFIQESPMPYQRSIETILQIAHALTHMHSTGVIHCDIKPDNILMTTRGEVKIIDFGIAHTLSESAPKKSETPLILGTPEYMSPEQSKSPHKPQLSWDIYSLGILLYELITKKLSKGKFTLALIPKGLQKVVRKCLDPQVKKRYKDIVDLITDLSLYINGPEFQKDVSTINVDQKSDIEIVKGLQKKYLFPKLPQWPRVEVGLTHHETSEISGIYYDFFTLEDGLMAIMLAEITAKGMEGIFLMNYLKGALKSLSTLTIKPSHLMHSLNEQIYAEPEFDEAISLSFIILDPATNTFCFSSCGYGPIWQISVGTSTPKLIETHNIALGIDIGHDFLEIKQTWAVGDTLFLHTTNASRSMRDTADESQNYWTKLMMDSLYLDPQKQVDKIYRKALKGKHPSELSKPFVLLSMQRRH